MCGIAAVLLYPQERSAAEWLAIRDVFTHNLLFNEERGRAATGLAVVQTDGQVYLFKAPRSACEFVELPAYRHLLDQVGPKTTLILGHTRLPTKGDPACAANNHPVHTGPVFGVHNGHIPNDDDLFARFGYSRLGQVDSEIIFQMLAAVAPGEDSGVYLGQVLPHLAVVQGQVTVVACDQRAPHRLLVLKHNNPLCLHYHPGWSAIIFSSRYIFLRKAFGQSIITEAIEHDQLMVFDATRIPDCHSQPIQSLPLL